MKNNITNEQIIQSARRQRQAVENRMEVEPWRSQRPQRHGIAAAIAIAASLISFIAGYGLHSKIAQPDAQPLAQNIQVMHDTVMQIKTVRDTVYQMRVVTKHDKPLMAQQATEVQPSSPVEELSEEQMAGSMLCDDIPYALLATP